MHHFPLALFCQAGKAEEVAAEQRHISLNWDQEIIRASNAKATGSLILVTKSGDKACIWRLGSSHPRTPIFGLSAWTHLDKETFSPSASHGGWDNLTASCPPLRCRMQKLLESNFLFTTESGLLPSRPPGSSCPLDIHRWDGIAGCTQIGCPFRGSSAGRTTWLLWAPRLLMGAWFHFDHVPRFGVVVH